MPDEPDATLPKVIILTAANETTTLTLLTETRQWCQAHEYTIVAQTMSATAAAHAVTTGEVDHVVISETEFGHMPMLKHPADTPHSPILSELLDALGTRHERAIVIAASA